MRGHGLSPGWHRIYVGSPGAETIDVPVLVVGSTVTHGIISDIDDTVLSTSLPRPMIAAWNTFMRSEGARRPVPGMATMYRELLAQRPDAPSSTCRPGRGTPHRCSPASCAAAASRRPMLLTDWGPTNSGWFRSGQEHKHAQLHRLARELPNVKWLLVGDDGQHDPKIYTEFTGRRPDRVRGIAIREALAERAGALARHPVANDDLVPAPTDSSRCRSCGRRTGTACCARCDHLDAEVPHRTLAERACATVHPLEEPPAYLLPEPDER